MPLQISKEEIEALAARCYRSPVEFARVFLPDWFPQPMPWVHRGIWALLKGRADFLLDFGHEVWRDGSAEWTVAHLEKILTNFLDEQTKKPIFTLSMDPVGEQGPIQVPHIVINAKRSIAVMMPRGSSKTTLINADNLHEAVYHDEDFFLYVSETGDHAARQLATVKGELEDFDGVPANELLNLVFGWKKPPRNSDKKWTELYVETLDGVMIGAVGTGGQIRGFSKRAKRPGKITFDDLQDEASVESETQRAKDSRWFFRAARPAKRKHNGRDIILGTLLHNEAILNKCIHNREFTAVRFGVIDRQGAALWEWWMNLEAIAEAKLSAAEAGELSGWYMEMMSEFHEDGARMFPESKLIYISKRDVFVGKALALDPAISEQRKSAMSAFAVAGIEAGGQKHIIDFYGEVGMDPAAQMEKFFELHFMHLANLDPSCAKHGIEAMAYQRALIPLIKMQQVAYSRLFGAKAYFEIDPIFHGKIGKMPRIKGILKPLIWAGQLTFEEKWGHLHSQFVDFPNGLLDGPDVCAMAIAKLDPFVMLGLADNEDEVQEQLERDTMPSLFTAVGGNFRSAP
jgi:hypothetical protein